MKPQVKTIARQPSWVLRNRDVELAVTQLGGHMAPVTFCRRDAAGPVQPYYISPWQDEGLAIDEPVLVPLRGDFFCLPFGANGTVRGTHHVVHGEPATEPWRWVNADRADGVTSLVLDMTLRKVPGRITKTLRLVDEHNVVYVQHTLSGCSGRFPLGHHATLAMPDEARSVHVATSPVRFGMTTPTPSGLPGGAEGEYHSLAFAKRFRDLRRIPLIWKEPATDDGRVYPARAGFTDLMAVFNRPGRGPAWTAAVFAAQGYLWFSLKDPRVLPATILWIANRGRHMTPWNGRNRCLGLEDVCGYFAEGLAQSRKTNALNEAGVPTTVKLSRSHPTTINYIEGVVRVPRSFGPVRTVDLDHDAVTFISRSGGRATTPVKHGFLRTGTL